MTLIIYLGLPCLRVIFLNLYPIIVGDLLIRQSCLILAVVKKLVFFIIFIIACP